MKFTCPHCNTVTHLDTCVTENIRVYQQNKTVAAPCCRKPIYVSGRITYDVAVSHTTAEEDDWGTPYALEYCDYIADRIQKNLSAEDPERLIDTVSGVKMDLHPTEGYFQSTKKTIEVSDVNGRKYRVTVESIDS